MSTIDTGLVGNLEASLPYQRKAFYAAGRYWVFSVKSSDMVYYTSTDRTTWSGATTARNTVGTAKNFSLWFDGTYVHYVFSYNNADGDPLVYRRGTPNSNGTITWSAIEQTVLQNGSQRYQYPTVVVDSNGNAWISYTEYNDLGGGIYTYNPSCIKNANTDGTWATASGFPVNLTTEGNAVDKYITIVPLTGGKIAVVYLAFVSPTFYIQVRTWTGSAWNSAQQVVSPMVDGTRKAFAAVAVGDDVEIAFLKSPERMVRHVKLDYDTNTLGIETTLYDDTNVNADPSISKTADGNLYVFWQKDGTNILAYSKRVSGTWDASPTDWQTPAMNEAQFNSFYEVMNGYLAIVYMDGTSLIFNTIDLSSLEPNIRTKSMTNIAATTATGNGNIISLGGDPATQHGHCWNTTGTPTTSDSKTENGIPVTGTFTSSLTSLVDGTQYYVRAYITNNAGTYYGNQISFIAGTAGGIVYPVDPVLRVTGIIHRYNRSEQVYSMELNIGGVDTSFGIPEWSERPELAIPDSASKLATMKDVEKAFGATQVPRTSSEIIETREILKALGESRPETKSLLEFLLGRMR